MMTRSTPAVEPLEMPNRQMNSWVIYELMRRQAQALKVQRKPQPVKTVWAIGSMEWQAEQRKRPEPQRPLRRPYPSRPIQRQGATPELVAGEIKSSNTAPPPEWGELEKMTRTAGNRDPDECRLES
jgi:hypothetical protein